LTTCKIFVTVNFVEKYCTIKDAAKWLERSRPTVYKLIADGKLRVERIAGRPFIRISDIQKRIEAREARESNVAIKRLP
jgi:excisionase family DNA binding protein